VVVDQARDRYWLFLERVPGHELYQVGEFHIWQQAASWLAGFHARLAAEFGRWTAASRLLVYDREFYRLWPRRALAFAPAALEFLADGYERVIERLVALPTTIIHGEFYASNVLVQPMPRGLRVCPVDWEMAAVGPGLVDLAALSAGKWTEEQRRELAGAYRDGLVAAGTTPPSMEELLAGLDCCRLHLAVQCLGWASDWEPPAEHAQDWLDEARRLRARLGF
jgi:Ser/Thr protein kinase RdoA (MazF antagonist)